MVFLFVSSSGTPRIWMLGRLILFWRSLRLSSFLLIHFYFFLSDSFIYSILSSTSLILPSASIILLSVPSRVFLISFIALFIIYRWRSSIQSTKTRPGADCGSDHELLIAKFRLKLKNVGKTTRPFRYYLNQILYDYTVEVRNRFKGLDLIDRAPDELWTEVCDTVQETGIKTIPMKRNAKKQNGCLGRPYK